MMMMKSKWLNWFVPSKTEKSAWPVEANMVFRRMREVLLSLQECCVWRLTMWLAYGLTYVREKLIKD